MKKIVTLFPLAARQHVTSGLLFQKKLMEIIAFTKVKPLE